MPGHGLDGLAVLVPRLHAPPPPPVDGLRGGGRDAPKEGEQLHDGLLICNSNIKFWREFLA